MRLLDMTITSRDHSHTILVTVDQEDGVVAYAEIDGHLDPAGLPERCYVTTAKGSPDWEYGTPDGDWHPAREANVSLSPVARRAMAMAARAGLIAAGKAS